MVRLINTSLYLLSPSLSSAASRHVLSFPWSIDVFPALRAVGSGQNLPRMLFLPAHPMCLGVCAGARPEGAGELQTAPTRARVGW